MSEDTPRDRLRPLASTDGQPVFEEAWQAQALAIADTLVQQGLFGASEWSDTLGAALDRAASRGDADTQEIYYRCVVDALETLLAKYGGIDRESLDRTRADWEAAYRNTPHGQPVILEQESTPGRHMLTGGSENACAGSTRPPAAAPADRSGSR